MDELEDTWSQMLTGAIEKARASGRTEVADYLALKLSNDSIREASVGWLFNSFIEMASEANRRNSAVTIEREEPHEFAFRGARMSGSLLRIRLGVRCMTIEAGWTRLPAHGFMRGGALAAARIVHFGMPKAGVDLVLVRPHEAPVWNDANGSSFDTEKVVDHFRVLLAD